MALNIEAKSGPSSTIKPEIARRSADYHPSIWGDKFLAYNSSDHGKTDADTLKKLQLLKEEVKKMLVEAVDEPKKQLNLIDNIQRLGVSYHFENEIDSALQHMSDIYREYCTENDALHSIALCFRLLRQHGHNVSSDVFRKFLDNEGKFKEYLLKDARGMLSLYEATHHRVQEEDILEEALSFTASGLEHLKSSLSNPLADEITHALKCPIRKNLNRLGARHYISIYMKHDSHDKLLLEFSKLDFNLLQKMYQQELCNITRWWKDLDFSKKLPFARDRVVECYFWILGVYFEPQYQIARRFLTKVIMIASVVDDIYDLYGTFEELLLFTDAIERWNTNSLDELPEYMRVCYQALIDIYTEMEEEMGYAAGGSLSYRFDIAKNSFKRLAKAYLDEAKWYREDYFPTTEEYMNVAIVSSGYETMATNSFVGMGDEATREAFDWVSNDPLIVRASSLIARLCDDMTGHEFEQKKGDIPSAVECYMNQHGAKKQDAYAELQKRVIAAWKDINQECLRPTPFPMSLLTRIDNLTRAINILYDGDDGYTHSSRRTKDFITSVLVDSLP